MNIITVDFESYFSVEYSLKKMPALLYIRDPRFHVHGAGVKVDNAPSEWVTGTALNECFNDLRLDKARVVSHNANFDMTVLYEKYAQSPAQRVDTLGLCRALLSQDLKFDLATIAPLLKVGEKGTELESSKGLRDLPPDIERALGGYACNDADLCYGIYKLLWPLFTEAEVHDLVIRMSTEGTLQLQRDTAQAAGQAISDDRIAKTDHLGVTKEQLRSRDIFAELLRNRGIEPPMKTSPTTGKPTYAFSKQDPAFVLLQADPKVADLVAAKMAWASNNAITRINNLIAITDLPPYTLPVQLNYYGAHTGRLSGGGGINMQNLDREGGLRRAIIAPDDSVIVVWDQSGIEMRMNMWFSGETNVLEFIREGGDVYKLEAEHQFGTPMDEVTKQQRQFGKVVQLGCGFQMGAPRFRNYCATGPLGLDPIYLSEDKAYETISTYRANHPGIVASWKWFHDTALPLMTDPGCYVQRGPITLVHEGILLPNDCKLKYPNLQATEEGFIWGLNGKFHRIYGGIMQENVIQALAGILIKQNMVDIDRTLRATDYGRVVHQVHDEILAVAKEQFALKTNDIMYNAMTVPPPWATDLPLDAEGGYDRSYSK